MTPGQDRDGRSQPRRLPDVEGWPGWTLPWPPPTVIVVMAEWTDVFLWNRSPARNGAGDGYVLDPETLGISPHLAERLSAWNRRYGGGHADDPGENDATWWDDGLALAQELQREFDNRGLVLEVLLHDQDGRELPVSDRPLRHTR